MGIAQMLKLIALSVFICPVIAGPSAHAYYNWNSPQFDELSYNVKWVAMPSGHNAYASMQFHFASGVGGYMGSQFHSDGTQILDFAIWDSDSVPGSAQPQGSCARFGREGNGAHCEVQVSLQIGATYQLRLFKTGQSEQGSIWSCSFNGQPSFGSIFFNEAAAGQLGKLQNQAIGFLEYFADPSAAFDSSVGFYGPWGSAGGQAYYPSSAECNSDDHTGCDACVPGVGCGAPNVLLKGGPEVPQGSGPIWSGREVQTTMLGKVEVFHSNVTNPRTPKKVAHTRRLVSELLS